MKIRINNIKVPLESNIPIEEYVSKKLGTDKFKNLKIIKESVDFRKKSDPKFVYSVCIDSDDKYVEKFLKKTTDVSVINETETLPLIPGKNALDARPVIAGMGPAGLFCAYLLSEYGYKPLIIERGGDVDARTKSVEKFWKIGVLESQSNVQFGEGGAGTFSDGKLTTRISDPHSKTVLETFVRFGAPEEILYKAKPHIGTDVLKIVIKNMRSYLLKNGAEIMFNTKLENINAPSGNKSVTANGQRINYGVLVLAIGHSARDTFKMLAEKNFMMEAKDFAVGVRIEHLQKAIDKSLYGDFAGHPMLKRGEYNLAHTVNGRGVYTFCMCPGGSVVASSSEEGGVVTNGMSLYARDGENANSAIVVQARKTDFGTGILDGVEFQRRLEQAAFIAGGKNYMAPSQTLSEFLGTEVKNVAQPSYMPGVRHTDLTKVLPGFVTSALKEGLLAFDRKIKGFADGGAVITGVETRTSSPVRILRDENRLAVGTDDIYPIGEGAGYAGGIMSAAVDGLKTAEKIISEYKPF